jgi:hypothetical protein
MLAKKWLFVGIFTLLSLSLAIAAPPAVHPTTGEPLVITCLRGTPDAIDGDLSDWNLAAMTPAVLDAAGQVHTGQASWSNAADCSGQFYLLWDHQKIYMAVVVKDDKLSMNKTTGNIWNADAIEIFFSTTDAIATHTATIHYQYGFNANNQRWNWCNMDGTGNRDPDYLQIASSKTADGYICEASIEYGRMLSLNFVAGNTIGFHPVIDDTDDGDREIQMTWTSREAHDQSLGFGHILLSDTAIGGGGDPLARRLAPKDGAVLEQTWVEISWSPGHYAVSHNLYIGDNFDDVNNGAASTFRGNQVLTSLYVGLGLPGDPFPGGLVPGTTYYWRVDEVNDANAASPWKGNIGNFSIKPRTASNPNPADAAEALALNARLTWTAGYGAKLHTVYFGENFDTVSSAVSGGALAGTTTYSPTGMKAGKVYYWRVDETDPPNVHKGQVWTFTTVGAVGNPHPSNGNASAEMNAILTWTPSATAASHQVYIGTDKEVVRKADTTSPEYKGVRALGAESYDPGLLARDSTYYWRVDEVNNVNPNSPWKGPVWSFTAGPYLMVDNFESYNDIDLPAAGSNRIFDKWADGFLTPATNGAVVGNNLPPYAERTVVHDGRQSMPYSYDNNLKFSEATMTLTGAARDWTREGVASLSLWFRGATTNAADRMYVALNGTAVVYHDNPSATQRGAWTPWIIPLQTFADQGVKLTDVTSIAIGFGTRGNRTIAGGTGKMYIDDIRLYRPTTP